MSKTEVRGFSRTNPNKEYPTKPERQRQRILETGTLKIRDIVVPTPSPDDVDVDVAKEIAESFTLTVGIVVPVIVRRAVVGTKVEYRLVDGRSRLQASIEMGIKKINVVFIDGDEDDARLAHIAGDLYRKHSTVLQRSEQLAEYCHLALKKGFFSGQVDQKNKRGRPRSGVSQWARQLPVAEGRSWKDRRSEIRRAVKIAGITPEAKQAAREARLDNNQFALLAIADARGSAAQVRKVQELAAERHSRLKAKENPADFIYLPGSDNIPEPPIEQAAQPRSGAAAAQASISHEKAEPIVTTLSQMDAVWVANCRQLFTRLSVDDRQLFITGLARERCEISAELPKLLRKVFAGRKQVATRDLLYYTDACGFSAKAVRKALKELGYRPAARSRNFSETRFVLNADKNVKGGVRLVSDDDLRAPGHADRKLKERFRSKVPIGREIHEYLKL